MPEQSATKDYSALYTPLAILLAGALVAGGLYFGLAGKAGNTGTDPAPVAVDIKDVQQDGEPYIGDKNAKVVLAYWFDYQCPFCKAVDVGGVAGIPIEPSMPTLIKDYVNTGKLKIVFKDYAFLSDDSFTAANYENAVWKLYPDKFYEWHEAMFKAQDEEHAGFGNEASIVALMKKIPGIDADKVKADVAANSAAYREEAAADQQEGTSFGISGTPGFITGKTLIPGAAELDKFKAAIDPQL
ncbi:MAG: thioredoxin domain-containing protein [bacterium]|nr:thioredoxin domain-containing protein [bacterium]